MANQPTTMRVALYDPSLPGFTTTEVATSADGLSLQPNQAKLWQNMRQATRVRVARGSDVVIASSVPTDAIARVDGVLAPIHADSFPLNGTWYHFSAWNTAAGTAVSYLNLATSVYTEITSKGNATHPTTFGGDANGATRLPTSTSDLTFTVVKTPRRVLGGVAIDPRDVLIVQNGEDYPVIWDPGLSGSPFIADNLKCFRHLPLNPPAGALSFYQLATFSGYIGVASTTGAHSYSNSNSRYKQVETTAAPYNSGSNYCVTFATTALATTGDTAQVKYTGAVINGFWGQQINFIAEGTAAAVLDLFTNCKLEFSGDGATYNTIYDQSSTNTALSAVPTINSIDAGNDRWMVTYPLANVPLTSAARQPTDGYIRFTRKNGAPPAAYSVTILAIAGCGPGSGFEGGGEFTIAYTDGYTQVETGQIAASNTQTDLLSNMGGPSVVTSGSGSTSGFRITEFSGSGINYDYNLYIANSAAGTVVKGGMQQTINSTLQGIPQAVDVYWSTFGELQAGAVPLFWHRINLYTAVLSGSDHEWQMAAAWQSGGNALPTITLQTAFYGYGSYDETLADQYLRDPGVGAPSAFLIALPRAGAMGMSDSRTFAGQIKTPTGNYALGDIYFSRRGFPFRFTSIQDSFSDGTLDEDSGSRVVFAGETIKQFTISAASYAGASKVYVHTDQTFNTLGHAFAWTITTLTNASDLSLRERLSNDGTAEARSIAEFNGLIVWWNQHGVLVKYDQGQVSPLSYLKFDDIAANVPAARRGLMSARIHNFRYKCGYTPLGGSVNSAVMVWNTIQGVLESVDTMAAGSAEKVVRAFDSNQNGAGQRLLVYGSDGMVYGYEEGSGNVPVRYVSRELTASQLKLSGGLGFYIDSVELAHDACPGVVATANCVPDFGSPYQYSLKLDAQAGSVQWIQEQNADTPTATARTVYIDYNASVPAGKALREMTCEMMITSADNRTEAGS